MQENCCLFLEGCVCFSGIKAVEEFGHRGQKLEEIFSRERKMRAQVPTMQPQRPEEALCSVVSVASSCALAVAAPRALETASWGGHGCSHQGGPHNGWLRVVGRFLAVFIHQGSQSTETQAPWQRQWHSLQENTLAISRALDIDLRSPRGRK